MKIDPPLTQIPTCQTEKTGPHISGYHQSAHFRFCGKDSMLSGKLRDLRGRGTGWFNSLSAAHLLPFERLRQLATPWLRSETRGNYSAVHGLTSNSCESHKQFFDLCTLLFIIRCQEPFCKRNELNQYITDYFPSFFFKSNNNPFGEMILGNRFK